MGVYLYFLMTLLIEMPLVSLWLRQDKKEALIIGFLLNLFTWPTMLLLLDYTHANINAVEIGIAVVEGIGYWVFFKRSVWECLLAGFIINGVSYGLGVLLLN